MIRGTTPTLELNVDGIDLTAFKKIVLLTDDSGNAILAEWSYQIK